MTRVVLRPKALEELPHVLRCIGCRSCLVVTGASPRSRAILNDWAPHLPSGYQLFSPRGSLPDLAEALRCHRELGDAFDAIVAIGGGRVIDTAKAISVRRENLQRFADDPDSEVRADDAVPLVAVPTVPGSGSEVTPFAVAYREGVKHSISHPALAPGTALVDPDLMRSVSPSQQAISGLDAVAHGIEALLSNGASAASDVHARRAVELGWKALLQQPQGSMDQWTQLSLASLSGGLAIAHTRTTVPHALSYYFTSVHGVPHGHAVSLSMGRYLGAFGAGLRRERRLLRWSRSYDYVLEQLGAASAVDVERTWAEALARLGLQGSLGAMGIGTVAAADLERHVNPARFNNSPLRVGLDDALGLLAW